MKKPELEFPRGNMELFDTTIGWQFVNPKMEKMYGTDSMPQTAENVAQRFGISREEQDVRLSQPTEGESSRRIRPF
ncbi:hypothetical protein J6TS1_39220 [Siminovitchia terrae]|uniref:Uncharacterized protein n=1 Tax=Siminovitchia terrae TaxID=1914933 RepID=A0ABQ4L236_SIMTE|nr:hypothetical protein J22TS1_49310 [Siminovitchia terrae]GIN98052.1 hypothetical protein J6TS1_39220 [Siminovitchia terrae]